MDSVGVLAEAILGVKDKGKWRKRLCILIKPATFCNSLKLCVMDQQNRVCRIRDVIHSYLCSLNHSPTLFLICNFKVRCISFERFEFEELDKWVEILKNNLIFNYFHVDLRRAPKESSLYRRAYRRQKQLQHSRHSMGGASPTKDDDGYLHVTYDRICFMTGPGSSRPQLLATWTFDNNNLIGCGTARAEQEDSEIRGFTGPGNEGSMNLNFFHLNASAQHSTAPGEHIFYCDQAAALSECIKSNNRTSVYQSEWRRLTSIAVMMDVEEIGTPSTSIVPTMCNGEQVSHLHLDCPTSSCSNIVHRTGWDGSCLSTFLPDDQNVFEDGVEENGREWAHNRLQSGPMGQVSMESLGSSSQSANVGDGLGITNKFNRTSDEPFPTEMMTKGWMASRSPTDSDISNKPPINPNDRLFPCHSCSVEAAFQARKQMAMHSRRRFSSQPVEKLGQTCVGAIVLENPELSCGPHTMIQTPMFDPLTHTSWIGAGRNNPTTCSSVPSSNLHRRRWRQSEPQLVTIPHIPIPLHQLPDFLERSKSCSAQSNDGKPRLPNQTQQPVAPKSVGSSSIYGQLAPIIRTSICSTDSLGTREHHPNCSHDSCVAECVFFPIGAGEACASPSNPMPVLNEEVNDRYAAPEPCRQRRRLPSSWSTGAAIQPGDPREASRSLQPSHLHQPPLNRSLSTGCSPQWNYHLSSHAHRCPLQRYHTASASESISPPCPYFSDLNRSMDCSCPSSRRGVCGAKASLVSLSPSSLPLWADAPANMKPRTGSHYLSRDFLLALHNRNKQRAAMASNANGDQALTLNGSQSNDASVLSATGKEATHFHRFPLPHACTPVPEAMGESDDSSSVFAGASISRVPPPPQPSSILSINTNGPLSEQSGYDLRSYVNIVSTYQRTGLQPIDERRSLDTGISQEQQCDHHRHPHISSSLIGTREPQNAYANLSELMQTTTIASTPTSSTSSVLPVSCVKQPYINLSSSCVQPIRSVRSDSLPFPCSTADTVFGPGGSTLSQCLSVMPTTRAPPTTHQRSVNIVLPKKSLSKLRYAYLMLSNSNTQGVDQSNQPHQLPHASSMDNTLPEQTECSSTTVTTIVEPVAATLPQFTSTNPSTNHPTVSDSIASVNYVTIDIGQTEALIELDQKLRTGITLDMDIGPTTSSGSRSHRRWGGFTLPGSGVHKEASRATNNPIRRASSTQCGSTNQKGGERSTSTYGDHQVTGTSFTQRCINRLTNSFSSSSNKTPTPSNGNPVRKTSHGCKPSETASEKN